MLKARLLAGVVLLLLAGAFAAAPARQAEDEGVFRIGLPWKEWALDIRLADFGVPVAKVDRTAGRFGYLSIAAARSPIEGFVDEGRAYRLVIFQHRPKGSHRGARLNIFMKPVTPVVGAAEHRASELKNLGRSSNRGGPSRTFLKNVKTSEYKGVPVASYATEYEYDTAIYQGGTIPRSGGSVRHIAAYYVKDGIGVTLTLTGDSVEEDSERFFYSLLDSAKFVDTSAPSSSFDHYHKGRLFFLQRDYRQAAASLGKALTFERLQRQLDLASWRDLVSKLTDAYATTGDVARAKEVLDYGLTLEPENALFNMALARFHLSRGDTDGALASLSKAFSSMRKENPRAPLPDMKFDSVFMPYMKDKSFARAVKELMK